MAEDFLRRPAQSKRRQSELSSVQSNPALQARPRLGDMDQTLFDEEEEETVLTRDDGASQRTPDLDTSERLSALTALTAEGEISRRYADKPADTRSRRTSARYRRR